MRRLLAPSLPGLVACGLAVGLLTSASAQVNTEAMRNEDEWTGIRSEIGLAGAYASGNTRFLNLSGTGRVDVAGPRERAFVVGELRFARADTTRYVDRSFAHARLTSQITGPLHGEVFTQIEQNAEQQLAVRYLLGGGARLTLLRRPRAGLAVGLSQMFELERVRLDAGDERTTDFRASSYLTGRLAVSDHARLAATVYVQPLLRNFSDTRVLTQASLQVPVTRWMALRTELRLRHDTRPPAEVRPTDLLLEHGLLFTIPAR